MGYALQICRKEDSKVLHTKTEGLVPRDQIEAWARAYLDTAGVPPDDIIPILGVPVKAVFIRVVELDSNGSPIGEPIYTYSSPTKG